MLSQPSSEKRVWALTGLAAALTLALVAVALAPPGSLPYPASGDYSDAAISHWPNAYFLRESVWRYGQWPLWNPLRMLGQPFAANPLSKVWYPPQWLALILPPTLHLNLLIYLHLAWLGLGMAAWARATRLRPITGLLAALAWGLNPKLIGHLGAGHVDMVYALAWAPWVLWAVDSHPLAPPPRRGEGETWVRQGVMIGGSAALLALADLRIAFYMLPVAAIYALVTRVRRLQGSAAATERRGDTPVSAAPWKAWALAAVLVVLLTAVQTIPLTALGSSLTRARLTPQEAAIYSLPPRYLLGLLIPDVGGFQEWMTYLGLPVIGLAAAGLTQGKRRRQVWIWWGVAILALVWALGENGPLFLPIVERLPLAGWLRVPSRAWFVAALSLVVAAAYGFEGILEGGLGRWGRLASAGTAYAGLVWLVAGLAMPNLPGVITGTGAALLGTGAGIWMMGRGNASPLRAGGGAILGATMALSLVGVDVTLVRARPMTEIERPEQEILAHLDGGCGSVYSPTFSLIGPATAQAGIATLHGIDPFQLWWSTETIDEAAGVKPDGYSVIAPPLPPGEVDLKTIHPDIDLLSLLGVCWVVSDTPIRERGLQMHYQAGGVTIYRVEATSEMPLAGSLYLRADPSMGVRPLVREVCSEGYLPHILIPQAWAPGWQAWVDGKPAAVITYHSLVVVEADSPPGCHRLEIAYRPVADFVGMGITGMTLAALAGWAILRRRRKAVHG